VQLQKCFEDLYYKIGDLSVSKKSSKEFLSLPMYPELEESRQIEVVERFKGFF
jgi:dTDP-4-amino-4,6-dideoxygalactose transaminase